MRVRLPLPGDSQPLVLGQVLERHAARRQPRGGQAERPDDADRLGQDLHYPLAARRPACSRPPWALRRIWPSEGVRRLLVNACYWCLGMEDQIPAKSNVDLVGDYKPTPFGFGTFTKGVKPPIMHAD